MTIDEQIEKIQGLRLPEIQAQFAEIVGETTRSPNKTFLLRRIREALEARAEARASAGGRPTRQTHGLTKMTVEELQSLYEQEVGRPTSSEDKPYLIWKIRQARSGKIRVGPAREPGGERGDAQVVPFTLPRVLVADLDGARKRLGFKSRQAMLKRAVHRLLVEGGELDLATRLGEA